MASKEKRGNCPPIFKGENPMGTCSVCSGIAYFKTYERRLGRLSAVFEKIMLILITYDVNTETAAGRKRLAKIAKICCNYGQRVQNSVFECDFDASQMVIVKNQLLFAMDEEMDSIRIYNLGKKYSSKIEQYGKKESYDPEGNLIL